MFMNEFFLLLGSRSLQQTDTLEKLNDTVDKLLQKLKEVEDKLNTVEKKQQEQVGRNSFYKL